MWLTFPTAAISIPSVCMSNAWMSSKDMAGYELSTANKSYGQKTGGHR
jgi:hypothetical protein